MRDIKVKVWDTQEKKWLTEPKVELIHKDKSWGDEFYLEIKEDWFAEDHNPMRYIFVENTGLIDRNGKEVYGGDLIRIFTNTSNKYRDFEVKWWRPNAGFDPFVHWTTNHSFEVIGNIYEKGESNG